MASSEVPWILSSYAGGIALVLALIGALRGRGIRWTAFWIAVSAVSVLLALGSHSPLYRFLFEWVPPFRPFRYPEKFLLIGALAVSVFAAQGTDRWLDIGRRSAGGNGIPETTSVWLPILVGGALYIGLAASLAWVDGLLPAACGDWLGEALLCEDMAVAAGLYAGIAMRIAALVLCLGVVTWLYRSGRLRRSLASAILVALAVVDLTLAHREVNPSVESDVYVTAPWTADALDELVRLRAFDGLDTDGDDRGAAGGGVGCTTDGSTACAGDTNCGGVDCNDAALRVFGCKDKTELRGKHPSELSPPYQPDGTDSRTAADARIATAFETGMTRFEWRLQRKSFSSRALLTRLSSNASSEIDTVNCRWKLESM